MSDNKYLEQMINSVKNKDPLCHLCVNNAFIVSLKELLNYLSELNYDFGSEKISYKKFVYIWERKKGECRSLPANCLYISFNFI